MKKYFKSILIFPLLVVFLLLVPSCTLNNDEEPPENITNLTVIPKGEAVEFSWTNPPDSDFSYVEIKTSSKDQGYYHTTIVPSKASSFVIEELTNNVEYEFDFTSYDTSKNPSSGLTVYSIPVGLANIRNVTSTVSEDEIFIEWTNPKDIKFAGVQISVINTELSDEPLPDTDSDIIQEPSVSEEEQVQQLQTQLQSEEQPLPSDQLQSEEQPLSAELPEPSFDSPEQQTVYAEHESESETETEYSDQQISDRLSLNKKITPEQNKQFRRLNINTDNPDINSYKITGLTSGTSYSISLTAYDSDENFSETYCFSETPHKETDGLVYKLTADGSAYIIASFTGDNSAEHVITPEEEKGFAENPISVVIPKQHQNKPVVEIAQAAFKDCRSITEITIPSSVTKIGKNAFENCTGLTGVSIPESVTAIEDGTFWNCLNLKWLVIPKKVKSIGLGAILNDTKITTVFYSGSEKEWAALEKNIESGNAILKTFSKRIITKSAEIRFDYDGTTPIELDPPAEVENVIAEKGNCFSLLSWNNPSDKDFDGVKIELLDEEEQILENYYVSSSQNSFVVTGLENGKIYSFRISSFDKLRNYSAPVNTNKIKPELITCIDNKGFYFFINKDGISCSVCGQEDSKRVVSIPERIDNHPVTEITKKAFANDELLEILILPETVVKIANDAFSGCTRLTHIYYSGSNIQFDNIEGIEDLNASLRTDFLFSENDNEPPSEVTVDSIRSGDCKIGIDLTLPSDCDFYKVLFEVDGQPVEPVFVSDTLYAILNLENNVTYSISIRTQDIYGNISQGITFTAEPYVVMQQGVSKEGFSYILCQNDSVLSGTSYKIISYEQPEAAQLRQMIFPSIINGIAVTEIGPDVLNNCSNIESIFIPSSIELIDNGLFTNTSLRKIIVEEGNKVYSVNANGTILYSKSGNQKSLEHALSCISGTVDFTASQFTVIAPSAFEGCSEITNIILPARLKEIGDYAFSNCLMLASIYMPLTVKSIGRNVTEGCSKLMACNYSGTQKQFKKIDFAGENKKLISVIKYYRPGK